MTPETTLILINIAIIGIIACVIVKVYYRDEEKKDKELSNSINGYQKNSKYDDSLSFIKEKLNPIRDKISGNSNKNNKLSEMDIINSINNSNTYIKPRKSNDPKDIYNTGENIATRVFQEPIEKKHEDMMNQLHNKDFNTPLKDRVEENKKLKDDSLDKVEENNVIETAINSSIVNGTIMESEIKSHNKPVKKDEDDDLKELFTIDELIKKEKEKDQLNDETVIDVDNLEEPSSSQIGENSTYHEELNKQNNDLYSDSLNLLDNEKTEEEDEFGKSLDNTDMFNNEEEVDFLDLGEIKDTISNSNLVKNVKKFTAEKLIDLNPNEPRPDDEFIRNVKTYEFEDKEDPLYNLGKDEEGMNLSKQVKKPKKSIEILLNNVLETIKKGDDIIFNYNGENYSSEVLNIFGDDIEVKYRRKTVVISANDIRKRI